MYSVQDPSAVSMFYNRPKTGITEGKYWNEAQSGADMWSAWDLFTINRFAPGSSVSPYVNNMTLTPVPTGTFKNSFSVSNVLNNATILPAPLGTAAYTVVAYLPSLSSFGGTSSGAPWFGSAQRPGGLVMFQTNTISDTIECRNFLDTRLAYSAIQLYGSDFTSFASGGMVWSGAIDFRIVCPAANLTGAVYKGVLTWNQLGASPTVGNLIQNAQHVSTGEYEATLRSSVVEPALIEDIHSSPAVTVNGSNFTGMDNETIMYLVYQTPVQSITTGSTTFSLIANQRGNFAYYPKVTDPLAFSLGPTWSKPDVDPTRRHPAVVSAVLPRCTAPVSDSARFRELSNHAAAMIEPSSLFDLDESAIDSSYSRYSRVDNSNPHAFSGSPHPNTTWTGDQNSSWLNKSAASNSNRTQTWANSSRDWTHTAGDVSSLVSDLSDVAALAPGPIGAVGRVVSAISKPFKSFFSNMTKSFGDHSTTVGSSGFGSMLSDSMLMVRHERPPSGAVTVTRADQVFHFRELATTLARIQPLCYTSSFFKNLQDWVADYRDWLNTQADLIPYDAIGPAIPTTPADDVSTIQT